VDVVYFLRERTNFIRFYFENAVAPFATIKNQIGQSLPPFDDPPYSEDPEPPFLDKWIEADAAIQIVGLSCLGLLSDSLKLYFHSLQHRVIGFQFARNESKAFKKGFVSAYLGVLGEILETDWNDCSADFEIIEQVVLARNRSQHGENLSSFQVTHDGKTLEKHPSPFFMNEQERKWMEENRELDSIPLLRPNIEVGRGSLFAAIENVEMLADYIESRMERVDIWRRKKRSQE
jgi:hypothetical protein